MPLCLLSVFSLAAMTSSSVMSPSHFLVLFFFLESNDVTCSRRSLRGVVSSSVREAPPRLSYSPRLKGGAAGRLTELSGRRNGFRKETTQRLKTLRSTRNSCDQSLRGGAPVCSPPICRLFLSFWRKLFAVSGGRRHCSLPKCIAAILDIKIIITL